MMLLTAAYSMMCLMVITVSLSVTGDAKGFGEEHVYQETLEVDAMTPHSHIECL